MRYSAIVCGVAVAWLLAGCMQPSVTPKAPAFQDSVNSARDWDMVAQTITSGLAEHGILQPNSAGSPALIFIRVCAPDSTALRAVADALQTDILQAGGAVARTPDGAVVVNLDVSVVAWGHRDEAGLRPLLIFAPTPTMHAEALWDATVVSEDRVLIRLRQPFYIHTDDVPLYAARVSLGPAASWAGSAPVARTVRYE